MTEKTDMYEGFEVVTSDSPVSPIDERNESADAGVSDETKEANKDSEQDQSDNIPDKKDSESDENKLTQTDQDTKEDKTNDDGDDSSAEQNKPVKRNNVQKRINQIIKEREEIRREKERLEAKIKSLESANSESNSESEAPKEEDYDTYYDYLDALDAFDKKSAQKNDKPENNQVDSSENKTKKLTDSQENAIAILNDYFESAKKPDDFYDVIENPRAHVTGDMLEAIAECDDPANVLYKICKDINLSKSISSESKQQQIRSIVKIDLSLKQQSKPVQLSKSPNPITPVKGNNDTFSKSINDMSMSEYEKWANAREKSKASW